MPAPIPESAVCISCSYSLRGLTEPRCPECGRIFDPEDRYSYGPPIWVTKIPIPPARWTRRLALVMTAWAILCISVPGVPSTFGLSIEKLVWLCCALGGMFIVFLYVFQIAVLWYKLRKRLVGSEFVLKSLSRWLTLPVCALLVWSTTIFNWPMFIRFNLSQRALEHAVTEYKVGRLDGDKPHWIGLYKVDKILVPFSSSSEPGLLFVTGRTYIHPTGFHYGPDSTAGVTKVAYLAPMWRVGVDD